MDATSDITTPIKTCSICTEQFPATTEYFYMEGKRLSAHCKACHNIGVKKWQAAHPDRVKEIKQNSANKRRDEVNAQLRDKWHNDPEWREKQYARGLEWKRRNPNYKREDLKLKAANAVNNAVRLGRLPAIKTRLCAECGAPAQHYHHHNGYEVEHWLDVTPVCSKCHGKTWRKQS